MHLLGRGELSFHLDLAESAVARRAFAILRRLRVDVADPHLPAAARSVGSPGRSCSSTGRHTRSTSCGKRASSAPSGCRSTGRPAASSPASCCRSAYLRGAFLGAGSLSGPRSPHLEVRTPLHAGAAFVRSVASAAGVRMRVIDRESHSAAYAKSWEAIEGYLSVAGATAIVLSLEERALVAGLRAEANRLANADHANLVRQSRSASAQLDAARALLESGVARAACADAAGGGEPPARAPVALAPRARAPAPSRRCRRLRWRAAGAGSSRSTPRSRPRRTGGS